MSSTVEPAEHQHSGSASGGGGAGSQHSWNKDEFKKRRHAFETRSSEMGLEGAGLSLPGTVFESPEERTRRMQEESKQQQGGNEEVANSAIRRISSPSQAAAVSTHHHDNLLLHQRSISSPTLPYSPTSPWSPTLHPPLSSPLHRPHSPLTDQIRRRMAAEGIRSSIDGQRAPFHVNLLEDEDVCPETGSRRTRSRSSNHRIGEETGQKECDVHYTDPVLSIQQPSPSILSHNNQHDNEPELERDNEEEDTTLSRQIDLLTVQNEQLQKQLKEREQERDRLQEQLETQRQDRNIRNAYSPSGLPSRVLDGRKVLRDSVVPKSATPTSPIPISPHSRSSPIARGGYASPGSVDSQQKRFDFSSGVTAKLSYVERDIMVSQLDTLKRSNLELERRLHDVLEEKRKVESELSNQSEAFSKIQEREKDLSKDIETLRDENSHHTGAINKLQSERDGLRSENVSLHSELTTVTEKLDKTEKCYKEVEGENLSLEAEIDQLMKDKKKLFEEKQNLQSAVEDALKTKENYRSTIKQLREQNCVLESQLKDPSARKPVPPVKPDLEQLRRAPATKEQQTLSEVLSLRAEKSQLKGKLLTAQHDVDSLKAQLKDTQDSTSTELRDEISTHLLDFQTRVTLLYKDLESARRAVSTLSSQQQAMVNESFTLLADKCREHLSVGQKDRTEMADALRLAQTSLAKMEEDFEHLKMENAKLHSQKSTVSTDVGKLRQEIASLQDQKRMLSVQLSQNETLAQERDIKVKELEGDNKKLQDRLATTERNWKNEFVKLERDWQGKLAEAELSLEMISEEKESLVLEKETLESELAKLQDGVDSQAERVRQEMAVEVSEMAAQVEELKVKVDEKERHISTAREGIARLLVEKSCLAAQLKVEKELHQSKLQALEETHSGNMEASTSEINKLRESVSTLESDKSHLREQLALISEKEAQIGLLTTQVDLLEREKGKLQSEVEVLNKNHTTTLRDFHKLAETEQKRQLDNDKLKMTLTTEIELLKSKLKSVEEDKHKLEDKILEMGTDRAINSSAFQAFPQNKQVEQLKKQIVALQQETKQQRRTAHESSSSWTKLAELRGRLAALEAENKHLKESSRNSKDMIDVTVSLRKQVTEMSRKTFFLESEKKQLSEKNHILQSNLKVAREMKDRLATERVQRLHDENQGLQDRVRILEGNLTKKLMAADLKIVDTMKENDKLRQKLGKVSAVIDSHSEQATSLDVLAKQLTSESQLLQQMKTGLSSLRNEFDKLDSSMEQIQAIQTDLEQMTSLTNQQESGRRSATPTRSASPGSLTLPPVLKSLPPGYLSNLQGTPSRSMSPQLYNIAALHDKASELSDVRASLKQTINEQRSALAERDKDLELLQQRFVTMETKLSEAVKHDTHLCESVSSACEFELRPEQLQMVTLLQKQIENLQDQVIDRDVALQDIDLQMKKDYEMHDKKFANLKLQVLELREQLSSKGDMLRSKDQYIQKMEERYLECEGQLFKTRKEMEQFVAQGLPESMQIAGVTNVGDAIRLQDEELRQLRKVLNEFTFEISQLNSQLELIHREKGALQSKSIDTERMHIQMKEALTAEINYLRQLNLQLIEQHMKTEKATEILREVREAQDILRKQKERNKLEAELDATNLKLHEQSRKISDLERQLAGQDLTIKLLRAEKDHALLLTQHTQEMTNPIPRSSAYRPRSAGSARQPNYRISDFKARISSSGRNVLLESEFSIPLPAHNSSQGPGKVDILNLEEQPSPSKAHMPLTLGPMVVTDDESSTMHDHEGKPSKHQRIQKLRYRGHRRTASTGSNIIPYPTEPPPPSVSVVSSLPPVHTTIPSTKHKVPKYPPHRPGSAGSTRADVQIHHTADESQSQSQSPDHITESARGLSNYMNTLIGVGASPQETEDVQLKNVIEEPTGGMLRTGRVLTQGTVPGNTGAGGSGLVGQLTVKNKHKYSEMTRSKPANKSTDSNETTSSEGTNSEKSSSSDQSRDKLLVGDDNNDQKSGCSQDGTCRQEMIEPSTVKQVNRTESMSSTCSTVFSSLMPSRTQSFSVYDGGESSPYSHESASLEIGDSVENLQTFSRLGYNPFIMPIPNQKLEPMTSSSDEDMSRQDYGRLGRRKRSSGTGNEGSHDTPRHKDISDHSNSSCDSDQLQQHGSYHDDKNQRGGIPLHRNESISISDMEKYPTDVEMDQKAKELRQRIGRVRYSSTGSVKICYSESSNTSLEDISKH